MADLSLAGVLGASQDLSAADPNPRQFNPAAPQPQQVTPPQTPPPIPQAAVYRGKPYQTSPDFSANLAQAVDQDKQIQDYAQQANDAANQNAGVVAALSAVGNLAGAASGRGAIGDPGLEIANKLTQQASQQSQQFNERLKKEQDSVSQAKASRAKAEQDQILGQSLRPLIQSLPVSGVEKAGFYAMINAGAVDAARQAIAARRQQVFEDQMQDMNYDIKKEAHGLSMAIGRQDVAKNNIKLQNELAPDYGSLTPAEQRVEYLKQSKQYGETIKKQLTPITQIQQIDQVLGGIDTDQAVDKIARITGLQGQLRGSTKGFGTNDDKALFQAINKFVTSAKTEDFGSQFPDTEKYLAEAGLGFTLGERTFANMTRDPKALQNGLIQYRNEIREKLANAERGLDPGVLQKLTQEGRPTSSLQSFEAHLQANKDLGGYSGSLDSLPGQYAAMPGAQENWVRMSPIQKKQLLIQAKRLGAN